MNREEPGRLYSSWGCKESDMTARTQGTCFTLKIEKQYVSSDAQQAKEKMFSITNYQRNASQNDDEAPSHSDQNGHPQNVYK